MLAAIYARQSIEKADSVSIDAQIQRCALICEQNGWKYEVYKDVGFSGKNINRPNFERLIKDIKCGKINALVSYKLDRISRSITDFAQLLQLFSKYNVKYISSTEQFDTSSPVGRAMIYIVMVFAQLERETTTQRVTDNCRFRASRGLFMGGNTPIGYTSKKIVLDGRNASVLKINEKDIKTVKDIFSLYLSGFNTHQIARRLNALGITTSKNNNFSANAVLRILQNFTYCCNSPEIYEFAKLKGYEVFNDIAAFDGKHGMCCYFKNYERHKPSDIKNRLIAVGRHEPAISAKDFIAVQNMIDAAKTGPRRMKSSSRSYLSGLLKCAQCGHSFGLKYTSKISGEYSYYYCRGRAGRGDSTCSNDLWISARELEPRIEKLLFAHAAQVLKDCVLQQAPVIENESVTKAKRELAECRSSIKNLISGIGKGNEVIDRHITDYITELDAKCRVLEKEIEEQKSIPQQGDCEEDIQKIAQEIPELLLSVGTAQKNRIARAFIDNITVDANGNIKITWNI